MPAMKSAPVDALLNELATVLRTKSRTRIGMITGLTASVASRARYEIREVSPEVLLRIHETSGIPVAKIRILLQCPAPAQNLPHNP